MKIWFNGELLPVEQAWISVRDRGVLYGDGLFETLRVEKGTPMFLREHLHRLQKGAEELRFAAVPDMGKLQAGVDAVIRVNRVGSGYLRITLTRGPGAFGQPLERIRSCQVWMEAREQPLDSTRYHRGVRAVISRLRRNPASPLTRLKTLNYLESVIARQEAVEAGAEEALFLTTEGDVCEGSSSNLFVIRDGWVFTPGTDRGLLPGIVRDWVIRQCRREGIPVEERRVEPEELKRADELFLTNSTWGPFPCVRVDGAPVGNGSPGPVTRRLIGRWREMVE